MKKPVAFVVAGIAFCLVGCGPSPDDVCKHTFELVKAETGEAAANKVIGGDMASCVKSEEQRKELRGIFSTRKTTSVQWPPRRGKRRRRASEASRQLGLSASLEVDQHLPLDVTRSQFADSRRCPSRRVAGSRRRRLRVRDPRGGRHRGGLFSAMRARPYPAHGQRGHRGVELPCVDFTLSRKRPRDLEASG